jgi:hypothetical protein
MVFDERTLNDAKRNRPTCKSISDHMFRKLRVKKSALCMMFWALIRTVGGQEPLMLESQKDAPVERNIKINWFSMLIQSYFSGSKHSKKRELPSQLRTFGICCIQRIHCQSKCIAEQILAA